MLASTGRLAASDALDMAKPPDTGKALKEWAVEMYEMWWRSSDKDALSISLLCEGNISYTSQHASTIHNVFALEFSIDIVIEIIAKDSDISHQRMV